MGHPYEVVELKEKFHKWWKSSMGMEFARSFTLSRDLDDRPSTKDLFMIENAKLSAADLFWVSESMSEVARFASGTFPDTEVVPGAIPSRHGMAVFEESVHFIDVNARQIGVRAVSWGELEDGVHISLFSDMFDRNDEYSAALLDQWGGSARDSGFPRLSMFHETVWPWNHCPGVIRNTMEGVPGGYDVQDSPLALSSMFQDLKRKGIVPRGFHDRAENLSEDWKKKGTSCPCGNRTFGVGGTGRVFQVFHESHPSDEVVMGVEAVFVPACDDPACKGKNLSYDEALGCSEALVETFVLLDVFRSSARLNRFVQTVWSLMSQTVSEVSDGKFPKHTLKKARRHRTVLSPYRIVTLRKVRIGESEHDPDTGPKRKYTCRWIVRGHWRSQYLPSTKTHRKTWISTYIKGPGEAEFRVRPVVSQLVR